MVSNHHTGLSKVFHPGRALVAAVTTAVAVALVALVPGATKAGYRLKSRDPGKRVSVQVTGTRPAYAAVVAGERGRAGALTQPRTPAPRSPLVGMAGAAQACRSSAGRRVSGWW